MDDILVLQFLKQLSYNDITYQVYFCYQRNRCHAYTWMISDKHYYNAFINNSSFLYLGIKKFNQWVEYYYLLKDLICKDVFQYHILPYYFDAKFSLI